MIECVVKIHTVPRQQVIQKAPTMMLAYATSFEQAGARLLGMKQTSPRHQCSFVSPRPN